MLWDTDFAHFKKWHCDFIHVYHPDDAGGVYDVDNYAYKPIIDAFTRAFRTGDRLEHCSFSMYNYSSENIKTGTYIYICNRDEKVAFFQDFEKLVRGKNQD